MQDNIAFLRETKCNFFSEPCAYERTPAFHLAATKAHTLILTSLDGEKKSLSLAKDIKFEKKEHIKLLRIIGKDRLMIITTRFNVYLLDVDMAAFDVLSVRSAGFKYAQSLNANGLSYNSMKSCSDTWLMACGRFLFSFSAKTGTFALFKVFNDVVVDFCAHLTVKNQIFVLTDKKLYAMSWAAQEGHLSAKVLCQTDLSSSLSLAAHQDSVCVLNKNNVVELRSCESLAVHTTLELKIQNRPKIDLKYIFATEGGKCLVALNDDFAYMLSPDNKRIEQVTSLKHVSCVFAAEQMFDLQRKSENSVNLATFEHRAYFDAERGPKFYAQPLEDRVDLAFAYLVRVFFNMKTLRNYNATISNMMTELALGGSILQHKRFKEKVLVLFALMKNFSSLTDKAQKIYTVDRLVVETTAVGDKNVDVNGLKGSGSGVLDVRPAELSSF